MMFGRQGFMLSFPAQKWQFTAKLIRGNMGSHTTASAPIDIASWRAKRDGQAVPSPAQIVHPPHLPAQNEPMAADPYRQMLDSQPWGTIALDAAARVVTASAQTTRQLGTLPTPGQALHEVLPQLPAQSLVSALDLLGKGVELERDGMYLWIKLCALPDGGAVAATLSLIDITPLRRELDQRMNSLRFLSHDLRSPQNSILALAQLHELDHEAYLSCGGMGRIAELARYSLGLSEDFVISSLVGAMERRDFIRFDLRDTVRQTVALTRGVTLQLAAPIDAGIWIRGVKVFVARAVQNLVDNAINASPQGSCVTVALRRAGDMADIEVRDTAGGFPGLPARGRLTEFGRGPTRSKLGFGLGLKVTTQVVQMHGGELFAESNAGVGTTFTMRFPCPEKSAGEAPAHA